MKLTMRPGKKNPEKLVGPYRTQAEKLIPVSGVCRGGDMDVP